MGKNRKNMDNRLVVEIILHLISIQKELESKNPYHIDHKCAKYLLNQTLRQLYLPQDRYYVSLKAFEKWKSITNESMLNHYYKSRITLEFEEQTLPFFVGNESKSRDPRQKKKGEHFLFREVFHDDHIIPVSVIANKLMELDNPNYDNVMSIISKMSICRMLKEEDRLVKIRSSRPFDENEIIQIIYKKKGIEIQKL
jgi:hypothetical protein